MAFSVSIISPQAIGTESSTAKIAVGTRITSEEGKQYVYLKAASATSAAGYLANFTQSYVATLVGVNTFGPVAKSTGVMTADYFGWYQVGGWASDVVGSAAGTSSIGDDGLHMRTGNGSNGKVMGCTSATAIDTTDVIVGLVASASTATATPCYFSDPYSFNEA